MTLFKAARTRLRHFGALFMLMGPLGVSYALQDAWISRRMRKLSICIDREKELHRAMLEGLNAEVNDLVGRQQALRVASAQFRRYCEKQDIELAKPVAGI